MRIYIYIYMYILPKSLDLRIISGIYLSFIHSILYSLFIRDNPLDRTWWYILLFIFFFFLSYTYMRVHPQKSLLFSVQYYTRHRASIHRKLKIHFLFCKPGSAHTISLIFLSLTWRLYISYGKSTTIMKICQ